MSQGVHHSPTEIIFARIRLTSMTELLEKAITAIKKLPIDTQDAIAIRLLDEITDEQMWSARFAGTTDTQWDKLADKVRRSITTEETTPLEEIFPHGAN